MDYKKNTEKKQLIAIENIHYKYIKSEFSPISKNEEESKNSDVLKREDIYQILIEFNKSNKKTTYTLKLEDEICFDLSKEKMIDNVIIENRKCKHRIRIPITSKDNYSRKLSIKINQLNIVKTTILQLSKPTVKLEPSFTKEYKMRNQDEIVEIIIDATNDCFRNLKKFKGNVSKNWDGRIFLEIEEEKTGNLITGINFELFTGEIIKQIFGQIFSNGFYKPNYLIDFFTKENKKYKTLKLKNGKNILLKEPEKRDYISIKVIANDSAGQKAETKLTLKSSPLVIGLFFVKKTLQNLPNWNTLRMRIYDEIDEKFLKIVIEKGLKKETHKYLIKNNYSNFERFFNEKIRELVEIVLIADDFKDEYHEINNMVVNLLSIERVKEFYNANFQRFSNLVSELNTEINTLVTNELFKRVTESILSKRKYRQKLVDYFNEFITYLIVF